MARRRSSSSASAPDLSLEDYDPAPDEELICVVCHSVLQEPVECRCRHVFCRRCIHEWLHKNSSCPVCRKRVLASSLVPALPLVQNMVSRLKVKCRSPGCGARVAVENYVAHMNACEFGEAPCPHEACEHRCPRRDLEDHVKTCPRREVACELGCDSVLSADQLTAHSCVEELKRKLQETAAERDGWRRKADEAGQALGSLRDTLHRLGVVVEGLTSNLGDLGSRLRSAEAMATATGATRQPARRPAPNVGGDGHQLGVLFGSRTARLLEEIESDSDNSWSPRSNDSRGGSYPDDDDLYLDIMN
uniref:Putative zinc ion binding protein n=1 Tax=Ixodes ricinus TaxID=34613 RepID=V5IIM4_IXORI